MLIRADTLKHAPSTAKALLSREIRKAHPVGAWKYTSDVLTRQINLAFLDVNMTECGLLGASAEIPTAVLTCCYPQGLTYELFEAAVNLRVY